MNFAFAGEKKRLTTLNYAVWIAIGVCMTIAMAGAISATKWTYLMASLLPFLLYVTIKKPFLFPFGLYVLLIPFDSILVLEDAAGSTLTKFLGMASILTLLLSGIFEKKIGNPGRTVFWWGLYVTFGVLSITWARSPELMYKRIPTALGLFLLYFVVAAYKIKKEEYGITSKLIVFGGVAASLYEIVSYFFMGMSFGNTTRASISYGESGADPNHFGFSLLIPFSMSIGGVLSAKNRNWKILNWICLLTISFAILITASRGAFLGMAVIVLIFLFSRNKKNTPVITIIVMLSIIIICLPETFFERLSESYETGGAGRLDIWNAGFEALKHYWFIGAGLDNFPQAYYDFGPTFELNKYGPHNIYLGTAVELGIVGSFCLIMTVYKHYALIRRSYEYDYDSTSLRAALFGLLVGGFFLDVIWRKSFWLIWILIMMLNSVKKENSYT